jgi:hypothetical protein
MPAKRPNSDVRELLELLSSLYVPGVTPLREEQGRKIQARAGAALRRLQEDPLSADFFLAVDDGDKSWRSLPDLDLRIYIESITRLCDEILSAEGTSGIDQLMQEHFVELVSWSRTAKRWEKLGGERVFLDFPGNGPVLQPATELQGTSSGGLGTAEWLIRAASQGVRDEWLAASRRVDSVAEWSLNQLAADPLAVGRPFPIRVPLQGSLGRVKVGSRELEHWEICRPAYSTVPRGSHRTHRNGDLEVLYAPDPSEGVVWVTTARLVERLHRVQKVSKN